MRDRHPSVVILAGPNAAGKSTAAPKHKSSPTLPFSADEMKRILDACDRYPGNADRMKAFVLTMRHSGLRIGDTIALKRERVKGNKLVLLGHSSVRITERHYKPWVKTLQKKLEDEVRKAWS